MASIDVVALFDNVSCADFVSFLPDVLAVTESRWRDSVPGLENVLISVIVKLLQIVLNSSFLSFKDKVLLQSYGVPMGNPVSVSVADLFLGHFETSFLDKCPPSFRPLFYQRFVDDIFLIFDSKNFTDSVSVHDDIRTAIIVSFVKFLHDFLKDTRVRFTYELEKRGFISFLDCLISRSNYSCSVSVYRKKTHSNRYVSKFSYVPNQFIISTLNTLRLRALRYCSSADSLYSEFSFLRDVFINKHGFNPGLVNRYFRLEEFVSSCKPFTSPPLARIVFPFFGPISYSIRSILANQNISVSFKSASTLQSALFKPTLDFSCTDVLDKCNVVYLLSCDEDNCFHYYIGETTRSLRCRVKEHKSDVSGKKSDKEVSGIAAHSRFTGHSFSFARVLSSDSYYSNVVKKEALFILANRDSENLCNARGTIDSLFVSGPWYSLLHCFSLE